MPSQLNLVMPCQLNFNLHYKIFLNISVHCIQRIVRLVTFYISVCSFLSVLWGSTGNLVISTWCADSTDSLDSLWPSAPIIHHSWEAPHLDGTQSTHRPDVCNFLLVGQHWCVHVWESIGERCLRVPPYLLRCVQQVFLVLLVWFM